MFPHVIICHLSRKKLDANRDISEAAEGNEHSELAWNEFHMFIDIAISSIEGRGLYIDIHGQSHKK